MPYINSYTESVIVHEYNGFIYCANKREALKNDSLAIPIPQSCKLQFHILIDNCFILRVDINTPESLELLTYMLSLLCMYISKLFTARIYYY